MAQQLSCRRAGGTAGYVFRRGCASVDGGERGGRIQSSERKAKFLRERSSKEFYASLTRRLGFEGGMGAGGRSSTK